MEQSTKTSDTITSKSLILIFFKLSCSSKIAVISFITHKTRILFHKVLFSHVKKPTQPIRINVRHSDWLYRLFSHVKIKRIDLYK